MTIVPAPHVCVCVVGGFGVGTQEVGGLTSALPLRVGFQCIDISTR